MSPMAPFRSVGLTVKSDLDDRDQVVEQVLDVLLQNGVTVKVDAKRSQSLECTKKLPTFTTAEDLDLLLVIGGDGTILRAIRELHDYHLPILSVNRGDVGFLAELTIDEVKTQLPMFLKNDGLIRDVRSLLHVTAIRDGKTIVDGVVLNEAVISQGSIARLLNLRTTVDGEELTTYRADGLIIATPTGSTAYSLAAGGPIVHPSLSASILTPINSHSFSQKPVIIPGTSEVGVEVLAKQNKFGDVEVSLTLDGQQYFRLHRGDVIKTHVHDKSLTFLRRKQETFFTTLRSKLKWGERLQD